MPGDETDSRASNHTAASSLPAHNSIDAEDFSVGQAPSSAAPVPNASQASQVATAPSAAKTAFDDLDDDFDGLEDAKEGSADDDFANISRSGLDDFNAMFDSSPPASQAKSDTTTGAAPPFGVESTFDLGSLSALSTSGFVANPTGNADAAPAPPGVAHPAKPADPSDWDTLFASLDEAPPTTTLTAAPAQPGSKETTRPAGLARVLSEDGEHDDPILKNLTSMGYSRTDALTALEKYDYNLERVRFQSAAHSCSTPPS